MARTPMSVLGIVEQPYRGSIERAYVDCFYLARVLNAQLGALDLLLRGEAALVALQGEGPAGDPTAALGHLLDDGVGVLLDGRDLARLGLDRADLIAGVQVASEEHVRSWHQYQAVWFL